jgi:hypothetical protein
MNTPIFWGNFFFLFSFLREVVEIKEQDIFLEVFNEELACLTGQR